MKWKKFLVQNFALFSVVRGYNLVILAIAEYLACLFIFAPEKHHLKILLDPKINGIILVSLLCVAAGYIINNFYDLEKDLIDRPMQTFLNRQVSQKFKLNVYLFLNAFSLILAALVSWRVFLFFLVYQFLVWMYSHKINKIVFINNIYSVGLRVFPFFGLMIYYNNFSGIIFLHAAYLTIILLVTDILKDMTSRNADLIYGYQTLVTKYSLQTTKYVLTICILFAIGVGIWLVLLDEVGYMKYYFYTSFVLFILSIISIFSSNDVTFFKVLHYFFKVYIVVGVLSIVFIQINPLNLPKIVENKVQRS